MTDMIPRAEADARVAAALHAVASALVTKIGDYVADDILPSYGVDGELHRHDPEAGQAAAVFVKSVISALIPDDASAILDQMISDAVNEATRLTVPIAALDAMLAEADARVAAVLEAADKLGWHCIGCGHICGDPDRDLHILRKAGARACCPEREMEPLSDAIRALTPDDDRAALDAMLAEAETRGMLRAAEIARGMSFPIQDAANATCGLPTAADQVVAAIRAEAE